MDRSLTVVATDYSTRELQTHGLLTRCETDDVGIDVRHGYVAHWMVQASLPYKRPIEKETGKEKIHWVRRNGNVELIVRSGVEIGPEQDDTADQPSLTYFGVPYGSLPRIILAWFATEVVIKKSPEIELGSSVRDFFRKLGMSATGGERGTITAVKHQLNRLMHASIKVEYRRPDRRKEWNQLIVGSHGTDAGAAWWRPNESGQRSLWQPKITLSAEFFAGLRDQAVPVDLRAVNQLSQSPIAMDLYFFLTHRFVSLDQPLTIPWRTLQRQFGSESTKHKFAENARRAVMQVKLVYPSARVSAERDGLRLLPSPTSIARAA